MKHEVHGLDEVIALPHAVERDDRDAVSDGGVELDQTPRPLQHIARLQEQEHVRVLDVVNQRTQVAQVVGVEEACVGGREQREREQREQREKEQG